MDDQDRQDGMLIGSQDFVSTAKSGIMRKVARGWLSPSADTALEPEIAISISQAGAKVKLFQIAVCFPP